MLDDLSDHMPFSIQIEWENRKLELLIVPEWSDEQSEMRFAVHLRERKLGIIAHDQTLTDGWVWLEGDLDQEKANLVGERIDGYYQ